MQRSFTQTSPGSGPPSVAQATDHGLLFVDNEVRMIGQDCAYSIPLPAGKALWLFGDTFLGFIDPYGRRIVESMPCNTALISEPGLAKYHYLTGENGMPRQVIPSLPEEAPDRYRIWPLHGFYVDGRVYVYYVRVVLLPDKCWPYKFNVDGTGLAVADYPGLSFRRLAWRGSTIWWGADEPCYGAAVLFLPEEQMVYVYGTSLQRGSHSCSLARVPLTRIEDPEGYEYLEGIGKWNPDRNRAIPIMDGMPTEMSVSYNGYVGAFLAVHSWETTGALVARTAPHPWGPWSRPQVLWNARIPLRNPLVYNGPLVYAGKEHPEMARNGGKTIFATFVEFEEYFPRLVEVTFA